MQQIIIKIQNSLSCQKANIYLADSFCSRNFQRYEAESSTTIMLITGVVPVAQLWPSVNHATPEHPCVRGLQTYRKINFFVGEGFLGLKNRGVSPLIIKDDP